MIQLSKIRGFCQYMRLEDNGKASEREGLIYARCLAPCFKERDPVVLCIFPENKSETRINQVFKKLDLKTPAELEPERPALRLVPGYREHEDQPIPK